MSWDDGLDPMSKEYFRAEALHDAKLFIRHGKTPIDAINHAAIGSASDYETAQSLAAFLRRELDVA